MTLLYLEGARGSDWTDLPFLVFGLIAVAFGEVLTLILVVVILAAFCLWLAFKIRKKVT